MNPLSGVLDEAWRMYKAHARHLLAIAFVIYLVAAVIAALLALAGTTGALLGGLVGIIAAFLLQAALVKAVQDVRDGRVDMSIGETVSAATPYLGAVTLVYYRLSGAEQVPTPSPGEGYGGYQQTP